MGTDGPMSDQLPIRLERAATIGQDAIKILIKEPVKEAVREALLEEQIREEAYTDQPSRSQEEDSDDGGRSLPVKSMVTIIGIAGVIMLVRRMRSDDSGGPVQSDTVGQRESSTARPTE